MGEIIAQRSFQPVYILFDSLFVLLFIGLLLWKRNYMTVLAGIAGGILYMLVDYGYFHCLAHTRSINAGYSMFWVLLWMSLSYGFTNIGWIWLALSRDKHLKEWTLLVFLWWLICPMLAAAFGTAEVPIVIRRTTAEYHGAMAVILLVGYFGAVLWNVTHARTEQKLPLLRFLAIGIGIQFAWEAALLLGGIRSAELSYAGQKVKILFTNSLLETNLGIPYIYALYLLFRTRFNEQLQRRTRPVSFLEALEEENSGTKE